MAINKIIYAGRTLIDLTGDTVTADKVIAGYKFHTPAGVVATGTCPYDSATSDATATVSEILKGKTAYARGSKLTGNMPNNGAYTNNITSVEQVCTIPAGYHDGSGKIKIHDIELAKIIGANIKSGISILGVEGTYTGEAIKAQSKEVSPEDMEQTVLPDEGYDYLSQVVVHAVAYREVDNSAGGKTVTIIG